MATNQTPSPQGRRTAHAFRAWQRMLSGGRLARLEPSALEIGIEDIAHGLARVARWNGQTAGDHPFTVAQHSMLVVDIIAAQESAWPAKWRLAALLHDAPEYVIGDLISPFKTALGLDYRRFEQCLQAAIHVRFGLPAALPKSVEARIKKADRASAYLEATQLAGFAPAEAKKLFGHPPKSSHFVLTPVSTKICKRRFLRRFENLAREANLISAPVVRLPEARQMRDTDTSN